MFKTVFAFSWVLNGAGFVLLWYRAGHFPFVDSFAESYVAAGFFLGMMSLLLSGRATSSLRLGRYTTLGIILLYALSLGKSLEPSSYLYWYNYPSVFCFFFFRVISIAVMLCGAAFFAMSLHRSEKGRNGGAAVDMANGRNFLLLCALFFLVSEICGAWWSAKASGDFWQFSPAFFTSAGTFLLFMIPFHWPSQWGGKRSVRAIVGACIPVLILVVVMIRNH